MPYFTRQVAPSGGLIVVAHIGVSQARRNALIASSQPVPNSVPVQAMLDTGASCTCVDPAVIKQLSLTPTGSQPVTTMTTGTTPAMADQYDVSLIIPTAPGIPPLIHHTIPVLQGELLAPQGFHVLIGRDVLSGCLLTYDGQTRIFSLAY